MEHAIEAAGLTRSFGRIDAVRGLDLLVPVGSTFALVGPNGAGKTTTIKLLMNLLRPTSGRAAVLGRPTTRLGPAEFQRIGHVSENQDLPGWMSVQDLVAYCRPMYPRWDDELARNLQRVLNLPGDARLRSASRGTRMKAALLVSLAYHPDLVVLDEPFTGLDAVVREDFIRALLEAPHGTQTTLLSSHDLDEVERLADHVAFIDQGRLLFADRVETLLGRFRFVEITGDHELVAPPGGQWHVQHAGPRLLRFVDPSFSFETEQRLRALFPGADIRIAPMSLRDIFVSLVRSRPTELV